MVVVAAWHAWIVLDQVQPTVAPAPYAVLRYLVTQPGSYVADAWQTLRLAGAGLACGVAVAVVFAAAAWASPLPSGLVSPAALLMRTVPLMALIPVIARVPGYGSTTIITVASLICFFPTFVFVRTGLEAVPAGSADLFTVLGAPRRARLRHLAGPAAVPHDVLHIETPAPGTHAGIKGMGEGGTIGAVAAVANAVADALRTAGADGVREVPVLPDHVFRALGRAGP